MENAQTSLSKNLLSENQEDIQVLHYKDGQKYNPVSPFVC